MEFIDLLFLLVNVLLDLLLSLLVLGRLIEDSLLLLVIVLELFVLGS